VNTQTKKHAFPPGSYGEIQVEDLATLPTDARLIDVRERDEFLGDLGHLHRAELVPLASLPDACISWAKDAHLVMICRSGNRSSQAARALSQAGFTNVHNLVGGMLRVREKGV
jgi:sulfur dioxygenase